MQAKVNVPYTFAAIIKRENNYDCHPLKVVQKFWKEKNGHMSATPTLSTHVRATHFNVKTPQNECAIYYVPATCYASLSFGHFYFLIICFSKMLTCSVIISINIGFPSYHQRFFIQFHFPLCSNSSRKNNSGVCNV